MRLDEIKADGRITYDTVHRDYPKGDLRKWVKDVFKATPEQVKQAVEEVMNSREHQQILRLGYHVQKVEGTDTLQYLAIEPQPKRVYINHYLDGVSRREELPADQFPDVFSVNVNGRTSGHAWTDGWSNQRKNKKGVMTTYKHGPKKSPYPIRTPEPTVIKGYPVESIKKTMINSLTKLIEILKDRHVKMEVLGQKIMNDVLRYLHAEVTKLSKQKVKVWSTPLSGVRIQRSYDKKLDLYSLHSKPETLVKRAGETMPLSIPDAIKVAVARGVKDQKIPDGMFVGSDERDKRKLVIINVMRYEDRIFKLRFTDPWLDQFRPPD